MPAGKAAGETYAVVSVTPGSPSVDLWLDRETHLLERITGTDGGMPFSGKVVSYKVIDGAAIGFELHQQMGEHPWS